MDSRTPTELATKPDPHPWLRRFCYLTIVATFSLIAIGGHVTSNDVGLAVPDGFTTFGHNTLLAPLEVWWYDFGTRWEHGHRLKGNVVGMMTIVMAVWLLIAFRDRSRDIVPKTKIDRVIAALHKLRINTEGPRPWLRLSGVVMLLLVISQGIMGALRVSEISLTLAFVHGIVGQLILCSWVLIAVALSKTWVSRLPSIKDKAKRFALPKMKWAARLLLIALIAQLTLGSAVRHFKADKSPPDMLVYGQVMPPMSQESLDQAYTDYYARQMGVSAKASGISNRNPFGEVVVGLGDVYLQLAHRFGALVVSAIGLTVIVGVLRPGNARAILVAPALLLLALLGTQVALGVMTVLSGTAPLMATLHQATGAVLIAVATWLTVRIHLAEYVAAAITAAALSAQADAEADSQLDEPATTMPTRPEPERTPVTV